MRRSGAILLAAAVTLAAASDSPEDYAVLAPVVLAGDAPVQRLDLPAGVLASLQRADGGDLRLFDGDGRVLPMARAAPSRPDVRRESVAVLPILGSATALDVTGLSLTLDEDGRARVSGVDGQPRGAGEAVALGALIDTRRIMGTSEALELAVALPAGQPVTLTVDASPDLANWRPVASKVGYQATDALGRLSILLGDVPLQDTWLRVTWRASSPLLAPVAVRSATLVSAAGRDGAERTIAATAPLTGDDHAVEAALPFATPLTGLAVVPAENAVLPVRVLGRADGEQPWRVVGGGTAARIGGGARREMIAIDGANVRQLRIEADPRTDGFARPPALNLRLAPAAIVFAVGPAPVTLAAGRAGGEDRFLPLAAVLRRGKAAGDLPVARVTWTDQPLALAPARAGRRGWLLWSVLLLAVAVLGWMAARLARGSSLMESSG